LSGRQGAAMTGFRIAGAWRMSTRQGACSCSVVSDSLGTGQEAFDSAGFFRPIALRSGWANMGEMNTFVTFDPNSRWPLL